MVSKKILITGSVLLIIIVVASSYFLIKSKKKREFTESQTGISINTLNTQDLATPDVLYEDSVVGFSIKHPESLTIEDNTPEDELYYISLNLKKGDSMIEVIFKDTEFKNLVEWLKGSGDITNSAELVGATSMDTLSVSQYSYQVNANSMLATVGIDKGVLYLIKGPKDGGFWEDSQNIIVSNFSLAKSQALTSSGSGEAVIYEAEEVIE
mgnify:CR=1 FL=1